MRRLFIIFVTMELQARNLIIDTEYFVSNKLDFNNYSLQKLKKLIYNHSIKLYLTDITIAEVLKKIEELLPISYEKLTSRDGLYLKAIPAFKKVVDEYTNERLVKEVRESFYTFLKEYQINTISSSDVKVLNIYEMYSKIKPPFSERKKKEFPDAFALESIRMWCDKENNSAYLLSKDIDWINYVDNYNSSCKENFPVLICLEDLSSLINSVIRKDEELKDQVAFADKEIAKNWEIIKKSIIQKFSEIEFGTNGYDEEEIINTYLIDCKLLEKDILEAKDDSASYELLLEFDLIIKFRIPYYGHAFYDKEDDRYYNLEYSNFYSKQSFAEYVTIDFSFHGGLDRSFKIDEIEFQADYINLDYEDGEHIDIDEWSKNLAVEICGVDGGIITENGLGVMKFKNFHEAQKVFPELEIKTKSNNFTSALGNRITEDLRFETWKAMEFYSS